MLGASRLSITIHIPLYNRLNINNGRTNYEDFLPALALAMRFWISSLVRILTAFLEKT